MDRLRPSGRTFLSGGKTGTVVLGLLLAGILFAVVRYVVPLIPLLPEFEPLWIIGTGLIAFSFAWAAHELAYGLYGVTITPTEIVIRTVVVHTHVPLSTVRGLAIYPRRIGYPEQQLCLHVQDDASPGEARGIFLPVLSRAVQRDLFEYIISCHADVPVSRTLMKTMQRSLGRDVPNPVSDFPQRFRPPTLERLLGLSGTFSEATLFLMISGFLLVLATEYRDVTADLSSLLAATDRSNRGGRVVLFLLYMALGGALSVYHILKRGKKSAFAQDAMIVFAVGMSAGTGIFSGLNALRHSSGWLGYLISAWSIFYGALLLLSLGGKSSNHRVEANDARLHEIVIGLAVMGIIVYVNTAFFDAYWANTYGACIAYATLLNGAVRGWFPGFHKRMPIVGVRPSRTKF